MSGAFVWGAEYHRAGRAGAPYRRGRVGSDGFAENGRSRRPVAADEEGEPSGRAGPANESHPERTSRRREEMRMAAHLRVYPLADKEAGPQEPTVHTSLGDLLPLLALAHRNNYLWLQTSSTTKWPSRRTCTRSCAPSAAAGRRHKMISPQRTRRARRKDKAEFRGDAVPFGIPFRLFSAPSAFSAGKCFILRPGPRRSRVCRTGSGRSARVLRFPAASAAFHLPQPRFQHLDLVVDVVARLGSRRLGVVRAAAARRRTSRAGRGRGGRGRSSPPSRRTAAGPAARSPAPACSRSFPYISDRKNRMSAKSTRPTCERRSPMNADQSRS